MWLFLIFVAVPTIEIALFIKLGTWLGIFPTLAIILITAALGTYLVKSQTISTFDTIKSKLGNLQNPTESVAHAAMILFAGVLLLTPGFFTDAVGFSLLVPWFRSYVFNFVSRRVNSQNDKFNAPNKNETNEYSKMSRGNIVIEGEYWENKTKNAKNGKK